MKLIITESQKDKIIEKVVFKYLDNRNYNQIKIGDNIYFVKNIGDKYADIRFDKSDGWCGISYELASFFSRMMGIEMFDIEEVVGRWVEHTLQMNVKYARILKTRFVVKVEHTLQMNVKHAQNPVGLTLLEKINSNSVTCDECGWSWELSEGGNDPYVCHQCGYDNSEDEFIGKRVMVYYNLHKHTFSIKYKNKVILHSDYVRLGDVEFRVRQGGKLRIRREKQKNVHAFVIGNLLDYCQHPCDNIPPEPNDNIVTYNPYKYDSFVYKNTEEPIYNSKEVEMINLKNKLFVINETNTK